jgi:hypothetical protein
VAAGRRKADRLFATTWVRVEDTADGAVYRPEDAAIPLSRRPRERLQVKENGTARLFVPGPDDRYIEQPATWTEEDSAVVIRASDGHTSFRIVERSPTRLLVQVRKHKR